ncbi:Increased rDNA silencing protein [Acarospora aff. strigata]|nr:Increased rDNA silencing protein [Acarospora aff. strigata]
MTASSRTMTSSNSARIGSTQASDTVLDSSRRDVSGGDTEPTDKRPSSKTLQLPNQKQTSRSASPSDIAAKLAAARYTPVRKQNFRTTNSRTDRQRSRAEEHDEGIDFHTDTTSIAPTDVLVNLFEHKSSSRTSGDLESSIPHAASTALLSPKSVGTRVDQDVRVGDGFVAKQPRSELAEEVDGVRSASNVLMAQQPGGPVVTPPLILKSPRAVVNNTKTQDSLTSMGLQSSRVALLTRPPTSIMGDHHIRSDVDPENSLMDRSQPLKTNEAWRPPLPPPRKSSYWSSVNDSEPARDDAGQSEPNSKGAASSIQVRSLWGPRSPPTPQTAVGNGLPPETEPRGTTLEQRRRAPMKLLNPLLNEDSLANAIVASSLASSRAPSPTKLNAPPLPTRHAKATSFLLHQQQKRDSLNSRTPSPTKGLRQTMRRPRSSDDQFDSFSASHRHGRRNLLKKHPNKHHEGDRKRWRDQVTERERKRYEGVWAANKGVWVSVLGTLDTFAKSPLRTLESTMVSNVVVRDIWLRSHLPESVLEEIWELVDRQTVGMLSREEFVVGMWLIDQRLKGRKLPVKVSDSVWASVRYLSGIKLLQK